MLPKSIPVNDSIVGATVSGKLWLRQKKPDTKQQTGNEAVHRNSD